MANRKQINEYFTNDTIHTYYALDKSMMKAHTADRNDDAEATARSLLENADLPLLLRARACMILGCGESPDFIDMAKESMRVAELGLGAGELGKNLVEDCNKVLEEAQVAADEKAKEEKGDDEDEEEEEGMELVWRAGEHEDDEKNGQAEGDGKGQAKSSKESMQ
ncbi:hypothetical protein PRZ48_000100 [Zasmidium cellare]|uniref:Uncharacterized protein n=1 Tax=Zasmidium cellare TaxID=395010 RepID=A0ABR0EZ77_ZASCE|nr:hypothetical protein PRZ48_000100 [Zasmidium cellare]